MHPALARTDHRPWPLPPGRWTWRQRWCDLLFAHWPIPAAVLRPLVHPSLRVEEFEGTSWIGVVPFRMEGVMRRPLPDIPFVSAFPELNVRLYVERDGKPGVWFLSLDAANHLAVWAARRFFYLPYFHSSMTIVHVKDRYRYRSERTGGDAEFRAEYAPTSAAFQSVPGTLEHFLTERYCLYAEGPDGSILRTDVQHPPWSLQRAEAEVEKNSMAGPFGIELRGAPIVHFSKKIDVVIYPSKVASSA